MLLRLLLRLVVLAIIIGIVAALVPGIHVHHGIASLLWLAVLFSIINLVLGSILRLITLPVVVLTLGLFLFVIDAIVLGVVAKVSSDLAVDGFGSLLIGAILIAVFSWLAELFLPLRDKDKLRSS